MQENRDGSNADFFLSNVGQLLPLPEDFSYEEGSVLACNFGTAWGALKSAFTFPGGTVVIWGLGPVGLNMVLVARALGVRVLGVDLSEGRRRIAAQLGAETFDGASDDIVAKLHAVTDDEGPDIVIDTTGVGAVHEKLIATVKRTGTVVLVGLGHQTAVGPVPQAILRQVTIKGSWIYDVEDWHPMIEFIRCNKLDLLATVDRVVPIDEFPERIHEADAAMAGKIVFQW
jgi:threonine dehydrogenase-like Zn-dependent dehydrogenase